MTVKMMKKMKKPSVAPTKKSQGTDRKAIAKLRKQKGVTVERPLDQ